MIYDTPRSCWPKCHLFKPDRAKHLKQRSFEPSATSQLPFECAHVGASEQHMAPSAQVFQYPEIQGIQWAAGLGVWCGQQLLPLPKLFVLLGCTRQVTQDGAFFCPCFFLAPPVDKGTTGSCCSCRLLGDSAIGLGSKQVELTQAETDIDLAKKRKE